MMVKFKRTYAECAECERSTNHKIRSAIKYDVLAADYQTIYYYYMVIECQGCDNLSFLYREHTGEDDLDATEIQYPDPFESIDEHYFLDTRYELPKMLLNLYKEVIAAFRSKSPLLAGIGLRMLVEAVCIDQKIPGSNLQAKIKNLQTKGLISAAELPILDKLRLIGNVSAHKIKGIAIDKLEHAVQIINHVLKSVYILPKLNKKIKL